MRILATLSAGLLVSTALSAQITVDDFEVFTFTGTPYSFVGAPLDENSIVAGQGPNLVNDGCVYSSINGGTGNYLYGAGHFGLTNGGVGSSGTNGQIEMQYDTPVDYIMFTMTSIDGFPETATVTAYDVAGALVFTQGGINLPNASTAATITINAPGVSRVDILGTGAYHWSPTIDYHEYGSAPGPTLALTGACPGPASLDLTGMTPGGSVYIGYGANLAAWNIPGGSPVCPGVVLPIVQPTVYTQVVADANGEATVPVNLPNGACGTYGVVALDAASCVASNLLNL